MKKRKINRLKKKKIVRCMYFGSVSVFFTTHYYPNSIISFRYLRLYGRNFSKEDHVTFINLFYNLMVMPEMGSSGVKGLAMLLQKLLKYNIRFYLPLIMYYSILSFL